MSHRPEIADLKSVLPTAHEHGLAIMGAFHPLADDGAPKGCKTLVLLGPLEPGFWNIVSASPEFQDGRPNPLDRWSFRVISALAQQHGGTAIFPFQGPPFAPFIDWAKRSGRAWGSPVGLLVHDVAGLFASYRGAIALNDRFDLPEHATSPCEGCKAKPCLAACPAQALTSTGYDVVQCRAFLDTPPGHTCMANGCAVRAACPVSQSYGRLAVQSQFHMRAFHR